jgi:S-adenosylmethionine hydrolase
VRPVVTFLTDFGLQDPFVGIMKGVVLGICPEAQLVDLCHEIPAHDILGGSFLLQSAVDFFPHGTIHVAVVDPGVGGLRRPILAEIDGRLFVAPDNGLLSYPLAFAQGHRIRNLTAREYWRHPVSASFQGRDVFAPVAAHLAAGVDPERFGPEVDDPVRVDIPLAKSEMGSVQGQVIWVDRFGNCITNISRGDVEHFMAADRGKALRVRTGARILGPLVETFGDLAQHATGAIVGSSGYVELVCNRANLSRQWPVTVGDPVSLEGVERL